MSNITLELCTEDRARIDTLIALLGLESRQVHLTIPVNPPEEAAQIDPQPAEPVKLENNTPEEPAATVAEPEPQNEAKQPDITPEMIQALVQKLASPKVGKRKEVKEIVTAYAEKVSGIPEDKRAECYERLTALEKGAGA